MDKSDAGAPRQEDEAERGSSVGAVLPSREHTVDIAAEIRAQHVDPSMRVRDESTDTHYVSRFVFKVNNTLSVTRLFLNKDPEKPQDLEAHTLKAQIGEVSTTEPERTRDILKLAEELEEKQREIGQEEEIILLQPRRPLEDFKPAARILEADAARGAGPSQSADQGDPQPSDMEKVETTSASGPEEDR